MVWSQQYNQEPGPASLNYISLGVGFVIGLQISGPLIDKVSNPRIPQGHQLTHSELPIFPAEV
jgi:hypothetical protein